MIPKLLGALLLSLLLHGCSQWHSPDHVLNDAAKKYVQLVVQLGDIEPTYRYAYWGPDEWRDDARTAAQTPAEISRQAQQLLAQLKDIEQGEYRIRAHFLQKQLQAVEAHASLLAVPDTFTQAQLSRLYFDTQISLPREYRQFDRWRRQLDVILPGQQDLAVRVAEYESSRKVDSANLIATMELAIQYCTMASANFPMSTLKVASKQSPVPWLEYRFERKLGELQAYPLVLVTPEKVFEQVCTEGLVSQHQLIALRQQWFQDTQRPELSIVPELSADFLMLRGVSKAIGAEWVDDDQFKQFLLAYSELAQFDINPETDIEVAKLLAQLNDAKFHIAWLYLSDKLSDHQANYLLQHYLFMNFPQADAQLVAWRVQGISVLRDFIGQKLINRSLSKASTEQAKLQMMFSYLSSSRVPSSLDWLE